MGRWHEAIIQGPRMHAGVCEASHPLIDACTYESGRPSSMMRLWASPVGGAFSLPSRRLVSLCAILVGLLDLFPDWPRSFM
jgi:hypothetical protein